MDNEQFLEIIVLLSPILALLGVLSGIIRFSAVKGMYKVLWIYLIIALAADFGSRIVEEAIGDNLIMLPLYGLLEFTLFAYLYYRFLLRSKSNVLLGFLAAIVLLLLLDVLTAETTDPAAFQSYGRVVDGLSIIGLSLLFFRKVMLGLNQEDRKYLGLNSGIMLFFLINSLWFLALNFLINHSLDMLYYLWMINALATPLFYLFLTYHIWQSGKTLKP